MSRFSPVTDADLARARNDAVFRQRLLKQSLDALLAALRKLRSKAPPSPESAGAKQIREGVELAVRLAELIQGPKNGALRP